MAALRQHCPNCGPRTPRVREALTGVCGKLLFSYRIQRKNVQKGSAAQKVWEPLICFFSSYYYYSFSKVAVIL